jgi:hypothetical protein
MGKNRSQKTEVFGTDPNTRACATCWYGEENEHGSIKCPLEIEPMGRADRCGEWTATEPETKVLINGVDVTDSSSPTGIDMNKAVPVIAEVVASVLSTPNTDETTSLSSRNLTEEMPAPGATTDFHLYKIEGFQHELGVALREIYSYIVKGGVGPAAVNIKLSGFEDTVKASMNVSLPHTVKLESTMAEVVRENGSFRIVLAAQPGLFEKEDKPAEPQEDAA